MSTYPPPADHYPDLSSMPGLKTSQYDKASSMLVSLLVVVGTVTGILFFLWLSTHLPPRPKSVPFEMVEVEEEGSGRGDHPAGFGEDALEPGLEDSMEVSDTPQIEGELGEITAIVNSSVITSLDAADASGVGGTLGGDGPSGPQFGTGASYTTRGKGGLGDKRKPGPLGHGPDTIPRWERWVMRFETVDQKLYGAQLDFFRIELGAVDLRSPQIEYAFNFSTGKPTRRVGTRDEENKLDRLFFNWKDGSLQEIDRSFLAKAGCNTTGKLIYQFFPKDVENMLAKMELVHAKGKKAKDIRKTVFAVKGNPGAFEFVIVEQTYRTL